MWLWFLKIMVSSVSSCLSWTTLWLYMGNCRLHQIVFSLGLVLVCMTKCKHKENNIIQFAANSAPFEKV